MSRKKIQHKGKLKHACEESEEFGLRKNQNENEEEEYTNVVDYEMNQKYSKRLIANNWSKYEASLSDFDTEDEEGTSLKTEDFTDLVKTSSSDCSHFEFNSEKLWKSEYKSVSASKIFNLDLNVLSKGLACVPFYRRLGLDERELSVEDKENFDREAENSWKDYNSFRENLVKKVEDDLKIKNLEKTFIEKLGLEDSNKDNQKNDELNIPEVVKTDEIVKDELLLNSGSSDCNVEESKRRLFLNENDENLEDWLDSVLDD